MKFIPELAGLRGLAACMVFVVHAAIDGFFPIATAKFYGKIGLICFFILSGYLIAQVYLHKPFTKENVRLYLIARVARILPLYFFVILVSWFISIFIYPDFHYNFHNTTKLVLSVFLIATPYEPWTIPVEVHFYLCFIAFWCLYHIKKIKLTYLFALFFSITIPSIIYLYFFHKVPRVFSSFSLFFFIGVLISVLHNKNTFEKLSTKIPTNVSAFFLILVSIIFPIARSKFGLLYLGTWYDPSMILIVVFLFILVISKPQDFRLLKVKPLIFMSEISYGFYLIHRPIMKIIIANYGTGLLSGALILSISVGLGYFCYRIIEIPLRNKIELLFKK